LFSADSYQGRGQGDQAREENNKQTFDLTAKEAKFTKKENVSEGFLRPVSI